MLLFSIAIKTTKYKNINKASLSNVISSIFNKFKNEKLK